MIISLSREILTRKAYFFAVALIKHRDRRLFLAFMIYLNANNRRSKREGREKLEEESTEINGLMMRHCLKYS